MCKETAMFLKEQPVYLGKCEDYTAGEIEALLRDALTTLGFEEKVRGEQVVIKPNLVRKMAPELGGTTHPVMLDVLIRLLLEMGAQSVLVAESPGGVYSPGALSSVYTGCGIAAVVKQAGGNLNYDCSYGTLSCPDGEKTKNFQVITPILKARVVINLCKLKSHGMMMLSAGAKNLFGTIPGVMKFEMHARFPDSGDFAGMLADLNAALAHGRSVLTVCDGIVGMEGNGPTGGNPRRMGVVLVSENPFNLDLAAQQLLSMKEDAPLTAEGIRRGYCPASAQELDFPAYRPEQLAVKDFKMPDTERTSTLQKVLTVHNGRYARFFEPRPKIGRDCRGCLECVRSCPKKTIEVVTDKKGRKRARIVHDVCIKCYCCQELCPFGCVKIEKNPLISLVSRL